MLDAGDKVTVLFSTLKGKGTKIKRGSLGYISSIGNTYKLNEGYKGVLITPTQIIFTRYGKEKKRRCETKFVALITSSVKVTGKNEKINYLNGIINLSKDSKEKIIGFFNKEGIHMKNIPCVIIYPENSYKNIMEEKNEFLSWSRSMLNHIRLNLSYLIDIDPRNKTLEFLKGDDEATIKIINSAIFKNNESLNKLLTNLFEKDKKSCENLVFKLKKYITIEKRNAIKNMSVPKSLNTEKNEIWRTFLGIPNANIEQLIEIFEKPARNKRLLHNSVQIHKWVKTLEDISKEI